MNLDWKLFKQEARQQIKGNYFYLFFPFLFVVLILLLALILIYPASQETLFDEDTRVSIIVFDIAFTCAMAIMLMPLLVGKSRLFISFVQGTKMKYPVAYADFRNSYKLLQQTMSFFAITISVLICYAFLIVPGVILYLKYIFTPYVYADEPELNFEKAMKKSSELMKGHYKEFISFEASFLGWIFLTIITAGIAGIYFFPYFESSIAKIYLSLKESQKMAENKEIENKQLIAQKDDNFVKFK